MARNTFSESDEVKILGAKFTTFFSNENELDNYIFRSENFYNMFLNWKMSPNSLQFDQCFSLNFNYHDINLSIPQLAMTPESKMELNYDSPIGCLIVIIGALYNV